MKFTAMLVVLMLASLQYASCKMDSTTGYHGYDYDDDDEEHDYDQPNDFSVGISKPVTSPVYRLFAQQISTATAKSGATCVDNSIFATVFLAAIYAITAALA
ncbi:hypothetical protein DPMN_119770 [Dreissena polymorpha]|uniref:Uncharacterized protein n=1 Tax=Dreissena polymorpha TaxID=45954 RepID=A0A9D4GMB0_DREPO|nr:hypothetical protein DPMN_119770 [Dreissena polymorpha]